MILIKGGTLINPKTETMTRMDVLIENERIYKIGTFHISELENIEHLVTMDATGLYLSPGFIDLHVHLREPGFEQKETIYTGSRACAKGGYTTVFCMPNTKPALDSPATIQRLREIINRDAVMDIVPVGAITENIEGKTLTDQKSLINAGVKALSDDGRTTMNAAFMKKTFEFSRQFNIPIFTHSEDHDITKSYTDQPFPIEAESNIIKRDLDICHSTNGILHVSHVSSAEAIMAIEAAKQNGVDVTCEVAPHHFALNSDMVDMKSPYSKVNPPIRDKYNQERIIEAIRNKSIDVIATDHAPHDFDSKNCAYEDASFGISGIESAFTVSYTTLVEGGVIGVMDLIAMLSYRPSIIGRLTEVGSIEPGYFANLVFLDLQSHIKIDRNTFISKGKNTPFHGFEGVGEVVMTLFKGEVIYEKNREGSI